MSQEISRENEESRQAALLLATEVLSSRVASLADAVTTNNQMIFGLRHEVNQKPDDSEVKFITGMAKEDRRRVRNTALFTAVMSALVSSMLAFFIADERAEARCESNKKLGVTITNFLSALPDPSPTLQNFIGDIQSAAKEQC